MGDGLYRIALSPSPSLPAPLNAPTNVFVLRRTPQDGVGLVNTGDSSLWPHLQAALTSLGINPRAVTRIAATSHSPHLTSAAAFMPWADVVMLLPPSASLAQAHAGHALAASAIAPELAALSAIADALGTAPTTANKTSTPSPTTAPPQASPKPAGKGQVKVVGADRRRPPAPLTEATETPELPAINTAALRAHVAAWRAVEWPKHILYLAAGAPFNLGGWRWTMVPTPGAGIAGASWALWEAEQRWLAAGDALHDQDEACWVRDIAALNTTLETLKNLGAAWLWPNNGECSRHPNWTLRHTHLFVSNFLTHFPHALNDMTSAPALVARDLSPPDALTFAMAVLGYQAFAESQVADGLIDAQGQGVLRTYGAAGVKRSRVMREPPTTPFF